MTRVQRSSDCGNSPKNKAVEDLAAGLEGGGWSGALVGAETIWRHADGTQATGATAIAAKATAKAPGSVRIDRVTTHGKAGAVSGVTDGEAFAHIFTFTSASAKQLAIIESFRKPGNANG